LKTVTNKQKMKCEPNRHANLRTAHLRVHIIIVHNFQTQHSTQQFRLSSLIATRWTSWLRLYLTEGRGYLCANVITFQDTALTDQSKHK